MTVGGQTYDVAAVVSEAVPTGLGLLAGIPGARPVGFGALAGLVCLPAVASPAACAGVPRASARAAQRSVLMIGFMVSLLAANSYRS